MEAFVEAAGQEIPRAFESDSYRERRNAAVADLEQRRQEVLARVRDDAARRHVAVELTPTGVVMVPLVDGHPVGPDEFQQLPQATRDALDTAQHDIEEEIAELVRTFRQIDREAHERVRTLDRDVALFAVGHLIDDVKARFAQTPAVEAWLERVREDVIDNLGRFTATMAPEALATPQAGQRAGTVESASCAATA